MSAVAVVAALLLLVSGCGAEAEASDELLYAVLHDDPAAVLDALKSDPHPNAMSNGRLLLGTAALYGYTNVVAVLVEQGAEVNEEGEDAFTPLHGAAQGGQVESARLLLQLGANPCALSKYQPTLGLPSAVAAAAPRRLVRSDQQRAAIVGFLQAAEVSAGCQR